MNVKNLFWSLLIAVLWPLLGFSQVEVTQDITQNTVWTSSNVYWVRDNITVTSGATLTIQPGTVVKIGNYYHGLTIEGTLNAVGTAASPVVFTSYADDSYGGDTNGDGAATQPARGNWAGLDFQPGSNGQLTYCRITYGGGNVAPIRTYVNNLTISNCYLGESRIRGIRVHESSPDISGTTFSGTGEHGIRIDGLSATKPLSLVNNTFENNEGGAVFAVLDNETVDISLSGNTSMGSPYGGFRLTGTIAGQVTYTGQDDFPFILWNTLTVNAGARLDIPFGTTFKTGNYNYLLDVYGTLRAQGSPQAPVIFTSYLDDVGSDTNADADASTPGPGNWGGIRFQPGSVGTLDNCTVSYGGGVLGSNVVIQSDAVSVMNSNIFSGRVNGIRIEGTSPSIENNLIGFNQQHGISITEFSDQPFALTGNDFQSNGNIAIKATVTDATNDILLTGNTYSGGPSDGFQVSGSIAGQVTYQGQKDFPFFLDDSSLSVEPGASLQITPGTVFKGRTYYATIRVQETAELMAQGTATDSIVFTSVFDDRYAGDSNNDGTNSQPAPANWGGIEFKAGSSGQLSYCRLDYGGGTIAPLVIRTDEVTLEHSYLSSARIRGIRIYEASPEISHTIFEDMGEEGIRIDGLSENKDFIFSNNHFNSTGIGAVHALLDDEQVNITLTGNTCEGTNRGGFGLQGSIAGQVTYTGQDNFPFILWSSLTVNTEASLTFPLGTYIKAFDYYSTIEVLGTLQAQGAPLAPVVFTSLRNDALGGDTNADADATSPAPGNWGGIRFHPGSSGVLDNCTVSYGGGTLGGNVVVQSSDVAIRNANILYSRLQGIRIEDASPEVQYNLIGFNTDQGISIAGFGMEPFVLTGNDFQQNGQWAVLAVLTDEVNDIVLMDNTVSSGQRGGFGLQGSIAGQVTYTGQRNFPFLITENILNVKTGGDLRIAAGSTVKFTSYYARINVQGRFQSMGERNHPVFYTSYLDDALGGDTNDDGDATSPAPGNWGGIHYQPGSTGGMEYSCVNFGAGYESANVILTNTDSVYLNNCAIGNTNERGLFIDGGSPTIYQTIFHQNKRGVHVANGADPAIERCEFLENTEWGLFNADASSQVFAVNNWWGSVMGPNHTSNASAEQADQVGDNVIFQPWLETNSGQDLIPPPVFGLVPYGNAVALENNSVVGKNFTWDFGDSTTSTLQNPYHEYAQPGNYELRLTSTSQCHVMISQHTIYGVKGINSFSPQKGGNGGTVTMEIAGGGFNQNTEVALVKAGGQQLPAAEVIALDGETLLATFNTEQQPLGEWNIQVTYPGGSTVVSEEVFVMEPTLKADPWLQVSGRETFLFNTWQTFQVTYGNRGNVDMYGVNLWLALSDLPGLEAELVNVDLTLNDYARDQGYGFITDVDPWLRSTTLDGGNDPVRALPLYIPLIPAGEEFTIKIRVRAQADYAFDAWLNAPYFNSPFNGELAACVSSVIGEAIFDAVPGVDCAKTVIKSVYKPQNAYRPGSMKVLAMPGMWDLVSIGVDCGMEFTGALGFAKDMIGMALNIRQYKADIDACVRNYERKDPKHQDINIVQSYDPNEKVGPIGIAAENYLPYQEEMRYTIYFENKDSATAPAHRVVIRDTLDADRFDLSSIELEEVVIADSVFTAFTRSNTYAQQIELRHLNVVVRITGEVDSNGVLIWEFISLDPVTLEEVLDPFVGFLPPNQTSPEGEGYVQFSIRLKEAPEDGQVVQNKADIFFDANEPIKTNIFANTFDLQPPATFVSLAEAETTDTLLQLQMNGVDARSGVEYYQIWYAEAMDTFSLLGETSQDTFSFAAAPGTEYHFYSIGVDAVGNYETAPANPDASVNVLVNTQRKESPVSFLSMEPNPAKEVVTVRFRNKFAGPITLRILNALGQPVYQRVISGVPSVHTTEQIRVADLAPGIYMLGLQQGDRRVFRRLVVQ